MPEALIALDTQETLFGEVAAPLRVNREKLAEVLAGYLTRLSLDEFVALFATEFSETIEYMRLCNGQSACQNTSLLFNPHRFLVKTAERNESVYGGLQSPHLHKALARWLIDSDQPLNGKAMHELLQLGIGGMPYVYEFRPSVARDLCERYHLNGASRVLDPCGGWGGRMLGCSVAVDSYTCYEPSTRSAMGLLKCADFIQRFRPSFCAEVICQPYEDSDLSEGYDLALTSPPYYDTERYADEDTQSFMRYRSFEAWCDGFFFPLVVKTLRQLKPGAPFVLNIGSRLYPLNEALARLCTAQGYQLGRLKSYLSASNGLQRGGEGETFYEVMR